MHVPGEFRYDNLDKLWMLINTLNT